jgi:hypothetical protein
MPSELENTLQFSDEVIKFIAECDNDTYQRFCNLFEFLFGDCLLVKDLGDWERLATVSQENLFKFVVLKAENIIHTVGQDLCLTIERTPAIGWKILAIKPIFRS